MSSKNSKKSVEETRIPPVLRRRLEQLRNRGHAGTLIQMHRSLIRLPISARQVLISLVLTLTILAGWSYVLNWIINAWRVMLVWWISVLHIDASVAMRSYNFANFYNIKIPYLDISAGIPGCTLWATTAIVTALIFKLPVRNIPFRYLLKAIAFIQICSVFFFLMFPDNFPHMLIDYHFGMMTAGLALITLVPVLFCFTYYIFEFKIFQKLFVTLLTMFYLCLLIPIQYLLHAYIIHEASLLFLPVLFFIFGLPLDILAVIAIYAWAMSWKPVHSAKN